jgi:hypothetical protein
MEATRECEICHKIRPLSKFKRYGRGYRTICVFCPGGLGAYGICGEGGSSELQYIQPIKNRKQLEDYMEIEGGP